MSAEIHQSGKSPASCPARSKRHTGSDGVRVLAMLGVAAFHIRPDVVPAGFLGVVIFLVLAGYYTTRSFTVRPQLYLGHYYSNKLTKLWPPLLFLLVLLGLFSGFLLPEVFGFFRTSAPSASLGWHNIAEILRDRSYFARHGVFDPLVHLWAMSLEMQYYLVFPLIYLLLSKTADNFPPKLRLYGREIAGWILLILGTASAIYMGVKYDPSGDPTPYYYNSFMRANAFLNGAGCCLIAAGKQMREAFLHAAGRKDYNEKKKLPPALRAIIVWLCLAAMLAAFFVFDASTSFLYRGGFYLYSLLAVAFILLGGVKPVAGMGFMDSGLFRYLASRSYHIYLWQYAIMVLLEAALRFSGMGFWPRLAIQLVLVLVLSEISYQLFDNRKLRPGLKACFSAVLALILFTILILPAPVEPEAPDLEGEDVLKAIQENESIQASLAAAETTVKKTDKVEAPKESEAGETTAEINREEILDKKAERESEENPYGYSAEACQVLENLNLVVVGDSVMATAMPSIRTYVPHVYIDAAVSRHFFQGPGIVEALDASGFRADVLVIALSTNGDIQVGDIDYFAELADDRPIIFVNTVVPNTWEQPNNRKLAEAAERHSNVYVADWYSRAKGVPEYFYQDATHPVPLGAQVYNEVIFDTLLEVIASGKYKLNPPMHFPESPPVTVVTAPPGPDDDAEPENPADKADSPGESSTQQSTKTGTKPAENQASESQPKFAPTAPDNSEQNFAPTVTDSGDD